MLSLSHPTLAALLADQAPPELVVDWLLDQDSTRTNLALLFAGTAPEHADGIDQQTLATWLRCQGEEEQANAVAALSTDVKLFVDTFTAQRAVTGAIVEDIERAILGSQTSLDPVAYCARPEYREAEKHALAVARRDLKRRILSLPWARSVTELIAPEPCPHLQPITPEPVASQSELACFHEEVLRRLALSVGLPAGIKVKIDPPPFPPIGLLPRPAPPR